MSADREENRLIDGIIKRLFIAITFYGNVASFTSQYGYVIIKYIFHGLDLEVTVHSKSRGDNPYDRAEHNHTAKNERAHYRD